MSGTAWGAQRIYKISSRHLWKALGSCWAVLLSAFDQLTNSGKFQSVAEISRRCESGTAWGPQGMFKIGSRHLWKALGSCWAVLLSAFDQLTNSGKFQ